MLVKHLAKYICPHFQKWATFVFSRAVCRVHRDSNRGWSATSDWTAETYRRFQLVPAATGTK